MPLWAQHLLVLLIVAACVAYVLRGMVRTLRGKKSKLGACCARGCEPQQTQSAASGSKTPPVHFFPADALRKR